MIVLYDCDGSHAELDDAQTFISRIREAKKQAWQGETGQVGLEHIGPSGSAWLFLSLIDDGRYLVYSQRPSGEKVYAVDPEANSALMRSHLLAGRRVEIADSDLVSTEEAIDAARYFLSQGGLLSPVVHWRLDGAPHWPNFG